MKAAVYYETGGPEVFRYEDVPDPVCDASSVLIDVGATSIGPEQHAARLRLQRVRMDGQKVIAENALLLVPEPVGLQHRLAALRARHHERHGGLVAW